MRTTSIRREVDFLLFLSNVTISSIKYQQAHYKIHEGNRLGPVWAARDGERLFDMGECHKSQRLSGYMSVSTSRSLGVVTIKTTKFVWRFITLPPYGLFL
jgi:hypothetical protein